MHVIQMIKLHTSQAHHVILCHRLYLLTLKEDNARKHQACVAVGCLRQQGVRAVTLLANPLISQRCKFDVKCLVFCHIELELESFDSLT